MLIIMITSYPTFVKAKYSIFQHSVTKMKNAQKPNMAFVRFDV